MVLGTFKPAHPCGESGLGASTGTMGLSWVRMQLSGLLWCWHNGHVPLLGRGKSPATLLNVVASDVAWETRGVGRAGSHLPV